MEEIADWLATHEIVNVVLASSGAATIILSTLQRTVDPLRAWAKTTATEADNRAVEIFARVVAVAAGIVSAAKYLVAWAALRKANDFDTQRKSR